MKKNHISHSDFKNFPKGLFDWSEKKKPFNEDTGIEQYELPPFNWSELLWGAFLAICGLFLLFVGSRIIFNW